MIHQGSREKATGLNSIQLVSLTVAAVVVVFGLLIKLDRAPSFGEMALDPIRLLVPLLLIRFSTLRLKIGVSRKFAFMGFGCVALTMLSEAFRFGFGALALIPAFAIYVWMLGHCWKNRGVDSGWVGLALCLMLAPVF
ncbi:MAG: hypothetical protein ACKVQS_09835 [Fimbriimonadaceae bacterium]